MMQNEQSTNIKGHTVAVGNNAWPNTEVRSSKTVGPCDRSPNRIVAPDFELQPSVPIHVLSDGEEQDEANLHEGPLSRCMFNGNPLVEVFLPVLIKNHWTLYVYDLHNKIIQLLDSWPGRKNTTLSGIQQNLAKVVIWLATHKKKVSPYELRNELRTFNFLTPDVPPQPNEHDCRVFIMKFMESWSMGGVLQIYRCGKVETL
ncbi:hypothetical protein CK203_056392 [Vitis vinifera]|uniref:Ubiquitin-like protease family profile domain-containing protein n=1 Tax=Vitis vinifera TaxID=29760 RepID=A0A438GPB6_VITVI|nr:hypothetical protein CK203_056392 [Vitis vinifera]